MGRVNAVPLPLAFLCAGGMQVGGMARRAGLIPRHDAAVSPISPRAFFVIISHLRCRGQRQIDGAEKTSHGLQLAVFLAVFSFLKNKKAL